MDAETNVIHGLPGGQVGVGQERSAEGDGVVALAQVTLAEVFLFIVAVVGHEDTIERFADGPAVCGWLDVDNQLEIQYVGIRNRRIVFNLFERESVRIREQ